MKKFLASMLAAAFLLSFVAGCGDTTSDKNKAKDTKDKDATVKDKEKKDKGS